jgi:colanic acid/amylovoran biosynthesis glycosyltransferase
MVLYLLRYYPTLTETFVYREIAELTDRGVSVHVAAIGEREDGALQDELPDVPVIRPPRGLSTGAVLPALAQMLGSPTARRQWQWLRERYPAKVAARVMWLAREAQGRGVVRIHAHFAGEAAEWAYAVADILQIPFSVTVHATDLFRPRSSLPTLLAAARPVVTVAEHHRAYMETTYEIASHVVHCGVDPSRYSAPSRGTADESPLQVVCVARYAPKKGVDALVRAVEELPVEVSLRLVSDAPLALASARTTVGALPPSQIPAVLAEADLFALPCRVAPDGDRDGIPVALMEAMASGLAVVTTEVAGIGELVDEEVGWLVPPGDVQALRDALLVAARCPEERVRRGKAGRARIGSSDFTVEHQVTGLLEAWDSA